MIVSLAMVAWMAADVAGSVTTYAEIDTNARRVPSGAIDDDDDTIKPPAPIEPPIADGLMSVDATLSASHAEQGLSLSTSNALGIKLFATQASERMIVGQTRASLASTRLPGDFALLLQGFAKGRAQKNGARTYGYARGDAIVERALPSLFDVALAVRGGVDGVGFNAFEDAAFSYAGAGALLGIRASVGRERLDAFVDVGARGFPFALADASGPERRADGNGAFVLQLTSARKVFLSAGYVVSGNSSNAFGEDYVRHRLFGWLGFRLPALVSCSMQGSVQLTQYSEGISIGQSFFLAIDDESQNAFEITLSRPLIGGVYVRARAGFYGNELAAEGARFSRQTAALGIGADL